MKLKYSFVCDAANVSQSGNLNVLGIFKNISATNFPATHSKMVYVASMDFHRSEMGNHKFRVNFVDDDGRNVMQPIEGEISVRDGNLAANIILEINNITFNKPGTYCIDLTIDSQHIASEEINLVAVKG
jgi:hypothetical protein